MLGILVIGVLSFIILWLSFKEPITVLGIIPNRVRIEQFLLGFGVMMVFCIINFLGQAYFKGIVYSFNTEYTLLDVFEGAWWTMKSVIFEELVFRGALLYFFLRKVGLWQSCLLNFIVFGIYHLFSYGLIGGHIVPMIYIFLLTGASGWMFAYAFAKTKSLYVPIGLHFGWILTSIVLFSEGPLGDQLLLADSAGTPLNGWTTLLFFLFQSVFVPGVIVVYIAKNAVLKQWWK